MESASEPDETTESVSCLQWFRPEELKVLGVEARSLGRPAQINNNGPVGGLVARGHDVCTEAGCGPDLGDAVLAVDVPADVEAGGLVENDSLEGRGGGCSVVGDKYIEVAGGGVEVSGGGGLEGSVLPHAVLGPGG